MTDEAKDSLRSETVLGERLIDVPDELQDFIDTLAMKYRRRANSTLFGKSQNIYVIAGRLRMNFIIVRNTKSMAHEVAVVLYKWRRRDRKKKHISIVAMPVFLLNK